MSRSPDFSPPTTGVEDAKSLSGMEIMEEVTGLPNEVNVTAVDDKVKSIQMQVNVTSADDEADMRKEKEKIDRQVGPEIIKEFVEFDNKSADTIYE